MPLWAHMFPQLHGWSLWATPAQPQATHEVLSLPPPLAPPVNWIPILTPPHRRRLSASLRPRLHPSLRRTLNHNPDRIIHRRLKPRQLPSPRPRLRSSLRVGLNPSLLPSLHPRHQPHQHHRHTPRHHPWLRLRQNPKLYRSARCGCIGGRSRYAPHELNIQKTGIRRYLNGRASACRCRVTGDEGPGEGDGGGEAKAGAVKILCRRICSR